LDRVFFAEIAFFCPKGNHMRMEIALIIPIYEPTEYVLPFLSKFKREDFAYFVVIDDGSGEKFQERFDAIKDLGIFTLLRLEKNKGKGKAMKTGLSYLLHEHPDLGGIVTADSDGQHSYEDVLRIRDALIENPSSLILGTRKRSEMPPHSQNGSWWSSLYFKIMTGAAIEDTQTGLRGIPSCRFSSFLATPGSRYEFEMGFLAGVAREEKVKEVAIRTIYLDNNSSTHFRKVIDSLRIAYFPLMYLFSGFLLVFLDCLFYWLFAANSFASNGFCVFFAGLSSSTIIFFAYELVTHCLVFVVKPRCKKVIIDFFSFVLFAFVCIGLSYFFLGVGLSLLSSRVLADLIIFALLFAGVPFLPSNYRAAYFLNH
jgi:glycosyltransferase involved in cell wall biosynthesis